MLLGLYQTRQDAPRNKTPKTNNAEYKTFISAYACDRKNRFI